jgi:hypothetical protein
LRPRQKARQIIATEDYPADYVGVEMTAMDTVDAPNPFKVDDAAFERFGGKAA